MDLIRKRTKFMHKSSLKIAFLSSLIIILFLIQITDINSPLLPKNKTIDPQKTTKFNNNLNIAADEPILFQGNELPLNITDYGNLYKPNQEISLTNEEELNLTYELDDVNNWKVSKIENSITNIQDTANWVNNSDIFPITSFSVDYYLAMTYGYNEDENDNLVTINAPVAAVATAMRVHFINISFQIDLDYIFIEDENYVVYYIDSGFKEDFFSPWIVGDSLRVYIESDNSGPLTNNGYIIDYYEFINTSSNSQINLYSWGASNEVNSNVRTTYGSGWMDGATAFYLGMHGDSYFYDSSYRTTYWQDNYIEIYQNISVPRGQLIDAYISFDYYPQFTMRSGNNFIYFAINNQEIYSKSLLEIVDSGKNQWHSTGNYDLDIWSNNSNIFDNILNGQELNISFGIKSKSWTTYSYYEDRFQQVFWFDNLSLVLTTIANSTQEGINLKINSIDLFNGNQWGEASRDFTDKKEKSPIILTFNTTSPCLTFDLNTTLYGFHNTTSKINQQNDEGIIYKILKNDTIIWEFIHNFYWPSPYSDFEFIIEKPLNWKFQYVKDQGKNIRLFEGGDIGDNYLKINKSEAVSNGWWSFKAISPNYLNISNTKMLKDGAWGQSTFKTGESTRIRTQINYSNDIPFNVKDTFVNLTIYDPEGSIWFEEYKNPFSNGTIIFSAISFTPLNTIGGYYNYTLFWTNGTSLGGLESNFIINHNSSIILQKPNDAIIDLRTEGFVGDLIPLRVYLNDSENNSPIKSAKIFYNWTEDVEIFLEDAGSGLYEAVIDTSDISRGITKIIINSSKIGYFDCNLTLEINLGETTNLQRLESDYYIELHANSTIKFKFSDFSLNGIDGAIVLINISDTNLYTINNSGNGIYYIEFSTTYIDIVGIYQLVIDFSAVGYEPQNHIYQFQIVEQSINISTKLNSQEINEKSVIQLKFNDNITISCKAMAKYDNVYLSGGLFTWITEDYEKNFTDTGDNWYNISIILSPSRFSLGLNYVIIKFQMNGYATTNFLFQIIINQLNIDVITIDFDDSVDVNVGEDIDIEIQLKESGSNIFIDGATISYSWDYGVGTLDDKGSGIYELELEIPEDIEEDNYKISLVISKEGSEYKSTEFSFIVDITKEEEEENPILIWVILSILIGIIGVLATLSYRSYVYLPKKRKKESELLARTQKFKDLQNIQAIVFIHKSGGVPVYLKSYSILEHQKKELFSGFIQAITTIGEELSGRSTIIEDKDELSKNEKIIEIDFKHFYCLIADKGEVRTIFILKDKSSDKLRKMVKNLSLDIYSKLIERFKSWDGSLDGFEKDIPPILNQHFDLFYKESFKLTKPDIIAKIRRENELNSMELRILNVLYSILKGKTEFYLYSILEIVHEENKDLIIDSIESLIERKILVPSFDVNYKYI